MKAPIVPNDDYPERSGEPDCPYYIKTQRCKDGLRCKFNHPRATAEAELVNYLATILRANEDCSVI
ncbi:hypothetical protein Bca52824_018714 [Brassica carinata]|uniref:C3H1-type domain-containing protein n=1 Tax=Brassica carinata TaxID=52824 RepID=A0A8X8AYU4_BRACI|nr:hypothetical protein Bca52824_018714 [Brassica carinata]